MKLKIHTSTDFSLEKGIILNYLETSNKIPDKFDKDVLQAVDRVMKALDEGRIRAAIPYALAGPNRGQEWEVNFWVLRAVALWHAMMPCEEGTFGTFPSYAERNLLKFTNWSGDMWRESGIRVYPRAVVRFSAFLAKGVRVLPSYIGPGTYIDEKSAIDGCVNVGSCAQIGKRVHIGAGAVIGGVLEPAQAKPVIIEDDCFIGANSSVVEGVHIKRGSVIAPGVHLSASTKIFDKTTAKTHRGAIPEFSVVVPGSILEKDAPFALSAAIIVKKVDDKTRAKTAISELLRS